MSERATFGDTVASDAFRQRAIRLEYFTIAWNAIEAVVAIVAGVVAGSIALVGFGLDSVIETLSGGTLLWRLRQRGEFEAMAESRALRLVGLTFLALAVYVTYESVSNLRGRERPEESWVGIILALVSLVVMPILGHAKRRVARVLGSRALAADGMETYLCSYLSFTLLLGLGLNAWQGWWWADPVAALAMVPFMVREGVAALRGE
ncbi:MAG: cation transporter [Acidobacteria bacterium]|nr:cation transporter [Acidobacteriota bacterium]